MKAGCSRTSGGGKNKKTRERVTGNFGCKDLPRPPGTRRRAKYKDCRPRASEKIDFAKAQAG